VCLRPASCLTAALHVNCPHQEIAAAKLAYSPKHSRGYNSSDGESVGSGPTILDEMDATETMSCRDEEQCESSSISSVIEYSDSSSDDQDESRSVSAGHSVRAELGPSHDCDEADVYRERGRLLNRLRGAPSGSSEHSTLQGRLVMVDRYIEEAVQRGDGDTLVGCIEPGDAIRQLSQLEHDMVDRVASRRDPSSIPPIPTQLCQRDLTVDRFMWLRMRRLEAALEELTEKQPHEFDDRTVVREFWEVESAMDKELANKEQSEGVYDVRWRFLDTGRRNRIRYMHGVTARDTFQFTRESTRSDLIDLESQLQQAPRHMLSNKAGRTVMSFLASRRRSLLQFVSDNAIDLSEHVAGHSDNCIADK